MINVTAKELFDAGVHVGHQLKRWNPRSKIFVYDHRHGISIIDLAKTLQQLEKACQFLENLVANQKTIWFVGTKEQAQDIVRAAAQEVHMPFCVIRWLGGTLTNFSTINRSLQKYKRFLKMEERGEIDQMPNKEASSLRRKMARLGRNFEGLLNTNGLPDALLVVDIKYEMTAVREARRLGIPVIALADTNVDPMLVDYPIPGNDDSVRSIRIIISELAAAVNRGLEEQELRKSSKTSSMIKRQEEIVREEMAHGVEEEAEMADGIIAEEAPEVTINGEMSQEIVEAENE